VELIQCHKPFAIIYLFIALFLYSDKQNKIEMFYTYYLIYLSGILRTNVHSGVKLNT